MTARFARLGTTAAVALAAFAVAAMPAGAASAPTPTVTSLAPHRASDTNRPLVAISGTGFAAGSTVSFGGEPAESTEVRSSTLIHARPPALTDTVDVRVTTGGHQSPVTVKDQYTIAPSPIEPASTTEDLGFSATDMSCGTDGYCLIPSPGRTVSVDGDVAGPLQTAPGEVTDVACLSASFCAGYGRAHGYVFNGVHWVSSAPLRGLYPGAIAIACAVPMTCLVVSTKGVWWRFSSGVWTSGTDGPQVTGRWEHLIDLSCGTATFCVAAADRDDAEGGTHSQLYRFDGSSWSEPAVFSHRPDSDSRVSCTSATYCIAQTDGGLRRWNGSTWITLTTSPKQVLHWVRCFAAASCLAAGYPSPRVRVDHLLRLTGARWTDLGEIPNAGWHPPRIDCWSMTMCRSLTTLDFTRLWQPSTGFGPATAMWDRLYNARAVSCVPGSFAYCAAVNSSGQMGVWKDSFWYPTARIDRIGAPTALSCTVDYRCVVVDDAGYAITIARTQGVTTERIDTMALNSVSCGSADFCVATDTAGRVVRFEGGRWHTPTLRGPAGALRAISCTASRFCLAVGHGYATEYLGPGKWTPAKRIADYTRTVACTSATHCVVGLKPGIRIWGGQAFSPPYAAFEWPRDIIGVSCPIEDYCLVQSDAGPHQSTTIYTAFDGAAHSFGSGLSSREGRPSDLMACWAPRQCLVFKGGDRVRITQ